MLLVKTKLKLSKVHGIGLFADEDILKGKYVGKNDDQFGIIQYSEKEWNELKNELSDVSFNQIKKYAYKGKSDGLYYLNIDDTRFINHSKNPNIICEGEFDIAIKDIKRGDEIFIDYETFVDKNYLIDDYDFGLGFKL